MTFTLASIQKGQIIEPPRITIYGVEGWGKTTLGSETPNPIFLPTEKGRGMLDIASFPLAKSWDDIKSAARALLSEEHEYETLVVDTVDWLEKLLWEALCEGKGKEDIEEFGFGKGFLKVMPYWRAFFEMLDELHDEKGMMIMLLAHAKVKTFQNPEGDNYDQYRLALHDLAGEAVRQWSDAVLFANYDVKVRKTEGAIQKDKGKAVKVHGDITHLLFTEERPAYWAKNRWGLPHQLAMAKGSMWKTIEAEMDAGIARAQQVVEKLKKGAA